MLAVGITISIMKEKEKGLRGAVLAKGEGTSEKLDFEKEKGLLAPSLEIRDDPRVHILVTAF